MCDDQVDTEELPRNKNTEQVNSQIKIHEEGNKIIKKKEERRTIPVSYTHLDVYKRQV